MPGTNPTSVSGLLLDVDPDALVAADGSAVTSAWGMTVPSGYFGPLLTHGAANGKKVLTFDGTKCLAKSLGANYRQNTIYAVAKPTDLSSPGGSFPYDRRVIAGLVAPGTSGGTGFVGLAPGGAEGSPSSSQYSQAPGGGEWLLHMTGAARYFVDKPFVIVMDGKPADRPGNGRVFKNLSLDGTFDIGSDAIDPNTYYTFNGVTLGQDVAIDSGTPGKRGWKGWIARFLAYDGVHDQATREGIVTWLMDAYGVAPRTVLVSPRLGRDGKKVEVALNNADGTPAYVKSAGSVSYRVNGGVSVNATPFFGSKQNFNGLLIELPSPLSGTDTITLTIPGTSVNTTAGPCEELTAAAVVNGFGQSRFSSTVPGTRAMRMGFNWSGCGQFWTAGFPQANLFKGSQPEIVYDLTSNSQGYPTSVPIGRRWVISSAGVGGIGTEAIYPRFAATGVYSLIYDNNGADLSLMATIGQTDTTVSLASSSIVSGNRVLRTYNVSSTVCPQLTVQAGSTTTPANVGLYQPGIDPLNPPVFDPVLMAKIEGIYSIRFMDWVQTNYSGIAKPEHLTPDVYASWAYQPDPTRNFKVDVSRIDVWTLPGYIDPVRRQYYKCTTSGPHGLVSGQGGVFRFGSAINITLGDGTTWNFKDKGTGSIVYDPAVMASNEFFFADYTNTGTSQATQLTPFTAAGAQLEVTITSGASVESMGSACNESGATVCWICLPHAATDACVEAMIDRVCSTLAAGKKLRVEDSNETWNSGFSQWVYYVQEAVRLGLAAANEYNPGKAYAKIAAHRMEVAKARWIANGRLASDFEGCLGLWYGSPDYTNTVCQQLKLDGKQSLFKYAAFAPYTFPHPLRDSLIDFSNTSRYDGAAIQDLHEFYVGAGDTCPLYTQHRAYLDSALMTATKLVNYEDGFAYLGVRRDSPSYSVETVQSIAAAHDPRQRGIWFKRWQDQEAHEVEETCPYGLYNAIGGEFRDDAGNIIGYPVYGFILGNRQPVGLGASNASLIYDGSGVARVTGWTFLTAESVRLKAWQDYLGGASPPDPPPAPTPSRGAGRAAVSGKLQRGGLVRRR